MRLGIDLGGTKIELAALAGDGRIVRRERLATPAGDYAATVARIAQMVHAADAELGVKASVGVGIPGSPSRVDGRIRNANSTVLNGRLLGADLESAVGREVRIANDANCFALSEAADGAGAGSPSVFGVIIGTGVGGGLILDGRCVDGANGIAGEWGHNPLPAPADEERPGPLCHCKRHGCIETWLSGPSFVRDFQRSGGEAPDAAAIVASMRAGDAAAGACFERYVQRLARSLATVINVFDPDVIVLGGGMSNIDELYERVPRAWEPHVFSDHVATRLARNVHGDSSGVRGAAWLWPAEAAS